MSSESMTGEVSEPGTRDGPEARATRYAQGLRVETASADELADAIDAAFDYRGNVTLLLKDGGEIEGYLSNRSRRSATPSFDFLPKDGGGRQRLPYDALRGLVFSGKDTASGKSWETWVRKHREKQAARDRGEEVGPIGLFPEEID